MRNISFLSSLCKPFVLLACFSLFIYGKAFSQKTISGIITGRDGKPLVGASITVKGAIRGVTSDTAGRFHLLVSPGAAIEVSYIGYLSQQIIIADQTELHISLVEDFSNLNDVVVIGYGTSKKKDLTGAVSSISEKDFNKGIYSSADQLIQGKLAGVQITTNNGEPGGAITIKIRGNSALTGTGQPLFVVDGVPLDGRSLQAGNNPLNFLNPIDIASIDVLKDASATAIYGSRAAYGVVIINTKKGQTGAPKLEVSTSTGFSTILKRIKVLNPSQYRAALNYYNLGTAFDYGGNVDALESVLQTASQQNYYLAGSGGNENAKYRFSGGYLNQNGIITTTGFKKYNADMVTSMKFLTSKKLTLDFHINASQYIQDGSILNIGNGNIVGSALTWDPTDSLYNADGSIRVDPSRPLSPLAWSKYVRDNLKVTTVLGSVSPSYKFTDWLEYKMLASINYSSGVSRSSQDQILTNFGFQPGGLATIKNYELTTEQVTQTLTFNKEILPNLHLDAVAGYEYMKFTSKGFSLSGNGVTNVGFGNYGLDYTNYIQYSSDTARSIASYIDPLSELQSFFGRAIFSYKSRYLLTATFRADGSTKFGANNKYGYFPSFAFAWNLGQEGFFKADWINSLKLRVGWGKTGNQEFPPGSAQALYAFQNNGSIAQVNNPNPNLKWQSDRQYNFGIDFGIFSQRLTGTLDYFNKKTTRLLFPSPSIQPAPPSSSVTWINLDGGVLNKGFEALINGSIIKNKKVSWDVSVNATFLHNNVSGLTAPLFTGDVGSPIEIIQNGHPMDEFYTRKFYGLDKATGFSIYQDSGTIFHYVGDPNPKFLLGITSTFRYERFSLIANMNGAFGQDIYNGTLMGSLNINGMLGGNIALSVYQNPVKESFANPVTPSSRYIQKGDYLKMSNLTISYNLEDGKAFKGANVYVTVQNLFLITKYEGFDPEVNVDRNINSTPSLGIDNVRYPSSRSFILGINFSL